MTNKIDLKNYENPGCVLVFNHFSFKQLGLEERVGTGHDVQNLRESFEDTFKFKFKVFNDLSFDAIQKTLTNYADPENSRDDSEWVDLNKCGSLVIVVLTHGEQGGFVCASDLLYHISHIWQPFIDCQALRNKLVWLVFQACRTNQGNAEIVEEIEKLKEISKYARIIERASNTSSVVLPRRPNTLLLFSTVENRGSKREDTGTWFISQLCKEVRNWSADYGLLAISKRVTGSVTELGLDRKIGQTPTCVSFLTADVVNSVKKAVPPKTAAKIFIPTASTSSTDSTNTSNISSTDFIFDTNLIESDASGNVNNKMPRYDLDTAYVGRAYIFYDDQHKGEAEYLKVIAENKMRLQPIMKEVTTDEDVRKDLKSVAAENNFNDESCLLVAALAKLSEKNNLEKDCPIITDAFLSTACSTLAAKPKVFLFLDKDIEEKSSENLIVSDSFGDKLDFATQHSDMIFIRGMSQELLTNFLSKLDSKCQQEDLMQIFTNSVGKIEIIACNKMLPHLESTLRRDIIFPLEQKELINLDILERGTNVSDIEYPCQHFVGRRTELDKLNEYFNSNGTANKKMLADVAIYGPIAVGKTQLIRKFKEEFESRFQYWILIESRKDNEQRRLSSHSLNSLASKALVVFEDFKPSDIQDLSSMSNLNTIILSREDCSHIARECIKLEGLEHGDAKKLCGKIYEVDTDEAVMNEFISTFHNHPLALEIMSTFTKSCAEEMCSIGKTFDCRDTLKEFKENKYCMFNNEDPEVIETEEYGDLSKEKWDEICEKNGF